MRTVASGLQAHIASGAATVAAADLYTITLVNNVVLRWTGGDAAVSFGGQTYAVGPIIKRGVLRAKMGLQADTLDLTIMPRLGLDTVNGVPLFSAARRGDFSGADVKLMRAYSATPGGTILDAVPRMVGNLGPIKITAAGLQTTVKSKLYLLDKPFPANVYSPACTNTLYDGLCQASKTAARSSGTVTTSVTQTSFNTSIGSVGVDAYRLGRFKFLTGANAGREQMVKNSDVTGGMTFSQPWPYSVAAGDSFEVFLGCDKTLSTCTTKFSNAAHFRGQPFIPLPETTT